MDFKAFPTLGSIAQTTLLYGSLDMTVNEAAKLMDERRVSSCIIKAGIENLVFSIEDLLSFVHEGGNSETPLRDLDIRKLDCLLENQQVLAGFEFLEKSGQRYLGVVNKQSALIGLVSLSDMLNSIDPAVLMERKTVGELVLRTLPAMYTADWILDDVLHHFQKLEDSIIVVESLRPIGIITAKDVFGILATGKDVSLPLAHYMISPVITTSKNSSIGDAVVQLRELRIKRAIVIDESGRVVGVVTQSELIGYAYGAWVNLMRNHMVELQEVIRMLEDKTHDLEKLTLMDVLTELGNRRLLHQQMLEEIERIRRYNGSTFSLVIIDVDCFKAINDCHGHLVGDEVLKAIAGELKVLIRKNDTAVRWGGEEFSVLLTNTPLSAATAFANRLREIIEKRTFEGGVRVTISAGVGEYSINEDEKTFFQRVDRALYRAKDRGRNLVESDIAYHQ